MIDFRKEMMKNNRRILVYIYIYIHIYNNYSYIYGDTDFLKFEISWLIE
jgi:hypothetical protein